MVDTNLLEERIKNSGKTKTFLAARIGCSVQALRLKSKNQYDFTSSEIMGLCNELSITKSADMKKIFFKK